MRLISKLCNGLNKNKHYKKQLFPALINIIKSEKELLWDQHYQQAWNDESKNHYFFFYKNINSFIIFFQEKIEDESKEYAFEYQLEQIKEGEGETPSFQLKVVLDPKDYGYEEQTSEIYHNLNGYEKIGKNHPFRQQWANALLEDYIFKSNAIIEGTNQVKDLEVIHQYLLDKGFLKEAVPTHFLEQTQVLMLKDPQVKKDSRLLTEKLKHILEAAKQLNLSSTNKFDWNDSDYVWLPNLADAVCIQNADMKFIAVNKEENWQIYHYSHYNDNDAPKHRSDKNMIEAIINGNVSKDNRLLFVQENKPIYVGDHLEYLLEESEYVLSSMKQALAQKKKMKL